MTTPELQVRRATVDDVPKLLPLWQYEELPWRELEKRFKEFQVVETAAGEIVAALGLETVGTDGRLHSEVFAHAEDADSLRELLWERTQMLGKNCGMLRLWTQFTTPFWKHCGFNYASQEVLAKLPSWSASSAHPWQFFQLREEPRVSVEKEFAAFKALEKERTERLFRQAKVLKLIAAVVVMAVFCLLVVWVWSWYKARNQLPR